MKGFLCFMLSALLLTAAGCSGDSNDAGKVYQQDAHLLSIKAKVIEVVEDEDKRFLMEALGSCRDKISQGDIISVTADSAEVLSILESYPENNSFKIYFEHTSDGVSVTCYDIAQYDSDGEFVQSLFEPKNS